MTPLRVAAPLASLFFFSSFASAQVGATNCTLGSWDWTFNSIAQSPCIVTAYLMATCDNGEYSIGPEPSGYTYGGPWADQGSNLCYCNTVSYSLFMACASCQGNPLNDWSSWIANCTKILPVSSFPNPVPSEIRVPQWALIDITNENYWNANQSYAVGDTPEVGPGSLIGASTSSKAVTASATSSTGTGSTGSGGSPTGGSSSHTGAIAGGIIGGIAVICIAVAAIFYYRRRHSRAPPAVSADVVESTALSSSPDERPTAPSTLAGSPVTMKFYNPNDPTTFPGYQGEPHSLNIPSQVTMSSNIGSGTTLAHAQTSLPNVRGYHGHPIL